nr:PREDICTED: epiplakin-like [Struthio camelus australis]
MQNMSGHPQNNKINNMGSDMVASGHKEMGWGGSNFIAGVFIQAMNKKMSIYDAMMRAILTPGTALVLLEAQAASGFLTDPVRNKKLSVKEALTAGLIGRDFYEKLLSAEGAVTGYTEPYTGHKISLFQAMKKEFIVKEHAIRLLEAQIATGGIIDPVHSHRIPVEVAYQCGYFDQEMCQFLSNPKNQRRSCFDPNTHENLTYTQLLHRCIPDPDTGLLMLHMMDKGSVLYQLNKDARKALQAARTTVSVGIFEGQSVTVWELLFSRYIPDHRREELLRKYKAGTVTIPEIITILTTIITRAEMENRDLSSSTATPSNKENGDVFSTEDAELNNILKSTTIDVPAGEFQGRQVSVWDLLHSRYIPEEKRQELLELYRSKVLTLEQMITVVTTVIRKKESTSRKFLVAVNTSSKDTGTAAGDKDAHSPKEEPWETALKTTTVDMEVGEFQGHKVSVWDLLHSKYIPEENRKELLELYQGGVLTLEQVKTVVSTIVSKAEAARAEQSANVSGPKAGRTTIAEAEHTHLQEDGTWEETLRSATVEMAADEFQGRQVSVWDLLHSRYIPEEKRQELLEWYRAGTLPIQELVSTISTTAAHSKEKHLAPLPQQIVDLLQTEGSYITFGQFQEQRVSVWELLSTKQVSEYKREAHLDTYGAGGLTVNKITITTTVITGPQGEKSHHQQH